jgi:Zn-finger protein
MPTFQTQITVDVMVDVDFEVFCSCGNGMCRETETRESRSRHYPQAVVEPCPKCLQAAKEEGAEEIRDQMQARIDELETELKNVVPFRGV